MGNVTIPSAGKIAGAAGHVDDHNAIHRALAGAGARNGLVVAGVDCPDSIKDIADYVCDGVGDEVEINQALVKASRPGDGLGGDGHVAVCLVGPTFTIAASITMPPTTTLMGGGRGTLIRPPTTVDTTKAAIELLNINAHRVTIRDLSIGRENAAAFGWHGIRLLGDSTGSTYQVQSGVDSYPMVCDVHVFRSSGRSVHVGPSSGLSNGMREAQIKRVFSINSVGEGVWAEGSDAKVDEVVATGIDANGSAGIRISGGNTAVRDCKVFYRGNKTGGTVSPGFLIESSRVQVYACEAQDNSGHGFHLASGDCTVSGALSDSNAALDATKAGFFIAAAGMYEGLHAVGIARHPQDQNIGILFSGSPQVYLTGRVEVVSGTTHVSGAPGANSYMRVVRDGATLATAG